MSRNEVTNNEEIKAVGRNDVNKLIALINLKEALINENYEGCASLVAKARGFGALNSEISEVLSGFTRKVNR